MYVHTTNGYVTLSVHFCCFFWDRVKLFKN